MDRLEICARAGYEAGHRSLALLMVANQWDTESEAIKERWRLVAKAVLAAAKLETD